MSQAPNVYTDNDVPEDVRKKFPTLINKTTNQTLAPSSAHTPVFSQQGPLVASGVFAPQAIAQPVLASRLFSSGVPAFAPPAEGAAAHPLSEHYYNDQNVPREVLSKFPLLAQRHQQSDQHKHQPAAQGESTAQQLANEHEQYEHAHAAEAEAQAEQLVQQQQEGQEEEGAPQPQNSQNQVSAPASFAPHPAYSQVPTLLGYPPARDAPHYTHENVPEEVLNKFPWLKARYSQQQHHTENTEHHTASKQSVPEQSPAQFQTFQQSVQAQPQTQFQPSLTASSVLANPGLYYFGQRPEGAKVYTQEDAPEELKKKFPTLQGAFKESVQFPQAPLTHSTIIPAGSGTPIKYATYLAPSDANAGQQ